MTTTISPFVFSSVSEVELTDGDGKKTLWKKEILPSGTRQYKGQTLDFSKINPACIDAFNKGAFDAVPFVLALSDNSHPESGQEAAQLEGDLYKMELSESGSLVGLFDFSQSPKVVQTIRKSNGKFGVSGRIEVDYRRPDTGETFPYALSHVCGTTRPHIRGMKPWESVELSEEEKADVTLDLSTEVLDEKETPAKEDTVTVNIKQEDLDRLLKLANDMQEAERAAETFLKDDNPPQTAQLSEEDAKRIELAEKAARLAVEKAYAAEVELAETRWKGLRKDLARDGVPPSVLDLAEKVLSKPQRAVIELSDNEKVDATEVITKMLEEMKGIVPMGEEKGHGVDLSEADKDDEGFKAFANEFFANLDKM